MPPTKRREREREFVMPILKDGTCFFLYSFSRYCAVVFRKTQLEIMGLVHLIFFFFYYYLFNLCVCVCFCVSGPFRRNELLPLKQTSPKSYLIIHWLSSPSLEFQPFFFFFFLFYSTGCLRLTFDSLGALSWSRRSSFQDSLVCYSFGRVARTNHKLSLGSSGER